MNLVFIGGGHSHAIALKKIWKQTKHPDVQVTLISDVKYTPYSGMLPGLIAGYYSYEQAHINLEKLAQFANVKLVIDRVINIKPDQKQIICESGKIVNFDLLSIDIGSTPKKSTIEGAKLYATPAKPVPQLWHKWQQIIEICQNNPQSPVTISIIGGGAGGVELALNMHHRLINILASNQLTINLIHRGERILTNQNKWISNQLTQVLNNRQINLYLETEIEQVTKTQIISKQGIKIDSDYTFLVTQAQAPIWLIDNLISTDQNGFILVKDTLQSINYDYIFATGDIATMINYDRPKAGVFAVRQGKPLLRNLDKYLSSQSLSKYKPQQKYLNIIGTGDKKAIAMWGKIGYKSSILWYVKEWLDFSFINQFNFEC